MKRAAVPALLCLFLATLPALAGPNSPSQIVVSVPDQRMAVVENGVAVAQYPVSTSRYGVGDRPGSYSTPLGALEIAQKIGANAPLGTVFKGRHATGEILRPNAPGRDPIVTRILWLRGLESTNRLAYERGIYIHGTPVEREIGRPASYGCIRMRSADVVRVFDQVNVGTRIMISNQHMGQAVGVASAPERVERAAADRASAVRRADAGDHRARS
jgi:lipoprotein-anchoring transpeptidase ErfK/SrfK